MGESRETRIQEFLIYNKQPVVGLKEGSFLKINQENIILEGKENAIIFKNQKPYAINSGFNLKKTKLKKVKYISLKNEQKVLLMILDGWGKSSNPNACAITKAKTPYIDLIVQSI